MMPGTPDRWRRLEDLCDQAIALDPGERRPFLAAACAGDAELLRDVEALLAHESQAGRFLKPSTLGAMAHTMLGAEPGDALGSNTIHPDIGRPIFQPNQLVSGRFRIVSLIGAGGMGEVYEAEDLMLGGEHIALKTLPAMAAGDDRAVERLTREIAAARRVTHPNVCRVFDVDQHAAPDGPITFFTMELLRGESLAARLKKRGRMDRDTARALLTQMAAGLGAVHAAGLVHGDFKPGNVMIVPAQHGQERVVVADFGLARQARGVDDGTRPTTSTHAAWGTPAYMAPEQHERRGVTPATDVYALGIVAREMVTAGVSEADLADTTSLDAVWHRAIERCLEREPARRFKSADEFVQALSASPAAPPQRRGWLVGLVGMASVVLVFVSTLVNRSPAAGNVTAADHVVAVLPFTSGSSTPDDLAYGRGLAAALTDVLRLASQLEGNGQRQVLVVPAAEVLEADFASAQQAQRTLSATVLLTGRFDRTDDRRAFSINVDDVNTARAGSYERDLAFDPPDDVPVLGSPVVSRLAGAVGLTINPRTRDALDARGTRVSRAEQSYLLGKGFLVGGNANLDAAISAFQNAIDLDRGYALAHAGLGDAYLRRYYQTREAALLSRAASSADEGIVQGPALAYAHVVRGRIYYASGQTERAIREFRNALDIEPNIVDARRGLAEAYESEGDLQAAEAVYRDEIALYPHYWSPHVMYGSFLIKHGRYREAETSLVNGLRYAPDNTRAIGNLAGLYILTERLAAAEAELRRGLALKPEVVVCNNLAWVNIYEGRFDEAVRLLEQAVQLPLADSFHWGNLARAYRWAGQPERAHAIYEKAIQLARQALSHNPRDARIRGNYAQMLAETGHGAEGRVEIAATLQRSPTDVSVQFRSALVNELTGDRDAALRALEAAVRGGYSLVDIRRHPDLARLRTDPRYVDVMALAGKIG